MLKSYITENKTQKMTKIYRSLICEVVLVLMRIFLTK